MALLEDGALLDYALVRPGAPDGVGDLHLGRISAVLPALGGAFVTLGAPGGFATGFLPDKEGAAGQGEGALIAVRVTRSAQGAKGPRVTARLAPVEQDRVRQGRAEAGLVERGPDALLRLAAAWPRAAIECDDPSLAATLHPRFGGRVRIVPRAFDDALEAELDCLGQPEIALPGGLRASFHPTPALVAVDMDGGASSAERRPKPIVQFAANRAAIPAVMHQLRLRNLSGAILLDPAGLAVRKRSALAPEIEAALARDPLRPKLLGFTALGLIEILRPRVHPPLHELLRSPHGAGLAALREALSAHGTARGPHAIRAGIAVITALRGDAGALEAFARRAAASATLRTDPAVCDLSWTIENG